MLVFLFLWLAKKQATRGLQALGVKAAYAALLAKTAPIFGVLISIVAAFILGLEQKGVAVTGVIPAGLPSIRLTIPSLNLLKALALPAFLISLIGYVESISVGKTLASKRRQEVDPNQELLGLGAANLASSISGGIPVTGGFSRSVVNFDAGAVTQMAGIFTAIGIALAAVFLAPVLYYLPKATLAATIIIAVISLIDISILKKTWRFARSDFWAIAATIVLTLLAGVEVGLACGVVLSIALHLYRTSTPHIAEVGLVEGTEHFRNVKRFHVLTNPKILALRPDQSLFFANAAFLEERIQQAVYQRDTIAHVVLLCSAVNEIDFSAVAMLEDLNHQLSEQGICLHLSEVKGPVMDGLRATGFLEQLSGKVYASQFEAFSQLQSKRDQQ